MIVPFISGNAKKLLIAILISLPGLLALVTLVTPPPGIPAIALAVNPLVLLVVFTLGGFFAAPRMNLKSRLFLGDAWSPAQLLFYLLLGAIGGLMLGVFDQTTASVWRPDGSELKTLFEGADLSNLTIGIFYGGITEEFIMRWGLLSLLALGLSKLSHYRVALQLAVVLTAVLFAAGHLPAIFLMSPEPGSLALVRTLGLNLIAGLLFGYAYTRTSLEAAFSAHMGLHLGVFLTAATLQLV
ncbi:CPBP family glutamic-type intramembrane protease [Aliiroseovarius sp. S1339]|uniref:CPBP family glutamic-type intramembrane protease n=1 Tax=Aliiroseovarius sp. S1339 TaxID=2936990 RepID=UPI0020BFC2A1|nr:CPBP family glutamic-type intramembrane protease [Aliiroseovarius sp. S1339]MCK8464168.1 CPBP family glutamic-type intramembrane protease [Aliiroseovarius sp. S1339]